MKVKSDPRLQLASGGFEHSQRVCGELLVGQKSGGLDGAIKRFNNSERACWSGCRIELCSVITPRQQLAPRRRTTQITAACGQ